MFLHRYFDITSNCITFKNCKEMCVCDNNLNIRVFVFDEIDQYSATNNL